ncbi:MAG: hypothetical protein NC182_01155 [Prevotella sp.]|nr:hypothetical protein [Staphylococcus sp.]MCM1349790.1 hypothetical protein [Prevotella sp.]
MKRIVILVGIVLCMMGLTSCSNVSMIDIGYTVMSTHTYMTQKENIEKLSKIIEEQKFIKYKEIPSNLREELKGETISIDIYYKIGIPKFYWVYPSGRIQLLKNNKNLYISESKVDIESIQEFLFCE